jgi:hypothetical protein
MPRFVSSLLKDAASNAVIKEAQARFSGNPDFPKDEIGVSRLFTRLDNLVPKEVQASGVGKQIYFFLLKLLFKETPPGFVLGEDDYKVKPLIKSYCKALDKQQLAAQDRSLDRYRNLEELETTLEAIEEKKVPKLEEGKKSVYTPQEEAIIKKGSKIIYDSGGWTVYKCPQSNSRDILAAVKLLCDNPRHHVSWCVGRGATQYQGAGDFFVFQQNGISRYAVSSNQGKDFTIWNANDTPIFSANQWGEEAKNRSQEKPIAQMMRAVAKKNGIPFDLNTLSVLPQDLLVPLKAVYKKEPALAFMPEAALNPDRKLSENVHKILHLMSARDLVGDLNPMFDSYSAALVGTNVLAAAVGKKVNMDFDEAAFKMMNSRCLEGYLEAAAGQGVLKIPKPLDDMLLQLMYDWCHE